MKTLAPALVFLFAFLLAGCFDSGEHPSSSTLLRTFDANRADFDRLYQMFIEDATVGRVAEDFTRPASSDAAVVELSEQRLSDYRTLFKRLGLQEGIEGYGDKAVVRFIASARGLSVSGSAKGYAYAAATPDLIVENLDAYRSPDGRSFTAYQHIDGNWYLYFDYED